MNSNIKRSDKDLKRDVLAELACEPSVKIIDVAVLVKNGAVRPNGCTTNHSEKWNAQPSPRAKTVLLVDDGDGTRITTKWFLSNFGYAIDAAQSAEEALTLFDSTLHDLVITDNRMPGMSGSEMAHIIKLRSPSTPVLMYTGMPPDDQSCVNVVVRKPTHMLVLKEAVEELLAASDASQSTNGTG